MLTAAHRTRRSARVIGVASGIGAPNVRCGDGPPQLLADGLVERLVERGLDLSWDVMLHPQPQRGRNRYRTLCELCSRLAHEVSAVMDAGAFPLVIGGDHSCAIGTWSGVARSLAPRGPLGLVWIDAHMDSHTPATSYSGMPHGMPLAALLGYGGSRRLCADVANILTEGQLSPRHVCLVGIRSNEPEEAELLDRLGVKVFHMAEVEARGIGAVLGDAVRIARDATAGYGVSLDLDAIDPASAPGVGTPESGGVPAAPLITALADCARDPGFAAFEVVEYDPYRDVEGRTARLVEEVIAAVLGAAPAVQRERRKTEESPAEIKP
jgi:arginase